MQVQTRSAHYDVIVVGAGHAGCEAARACARMGLKAAMVTMNADLIAQMSCNPAIGGIAKGHLVREVDALGGVMGEVTDQVGIQFRYTTQREIDEKRDELIRFTGEKGIFVKK